MAIDSQTSADSGAMNEKRLGDLGSGRLKMMLMPRLRNGADMSMA